MKDVPTKNECLFNDSSICQYAVRQTVILSNETGGTDLKTEKDGRPRTAELWDPVIERSERRIAAHYKLSESSELYIKRHIYTKKGTKEETESIVNLICEACRVEEEYFSKARNNFEELMRQKANLAESPRVKDVVNAQETAPSFVIQSVREYIRKTAMEIVECVRYAASMRAIMESIDDTAKWRSKYSIPASSEEKAIIDKTRHILTSYFDRLSETTRLLKEYVRSLPDGETKREALEVTALMRQ